MKSFILIALFCLFTAVNISAQVVASPDVPLEEPKVFTFVDQQPIFPGGFQGLSKFLSANLKAPKEIRKGKVSGKVVAQFVVDKEGGIEDIKIVKSLSPACDTAVVQVLRKMPRFQPAMQNKKPVKFRYTLPVDFHK